jgi:MFS family permease
MLLSSLGTSIANVALPTLAREFAASFQAVQWVVLAYLLAVTSVLVIVGRLGDLLGRRRLMLVGIVVFVLGSMACAGSGGLWALVAARGLQGLGAAVMMALSMAMIGDAVPPARAGRAMGLLGTMSAVGTALGPSLGGGLITMLGWPAIFMATAVGGLLAAAMAARHLPADPVRREAVAFDLPGSALLASALGAYALTMTLPTGTSEALRLSLAMLALVLGAGFLAVESRAPAPLVRLGLFREPGIGSGFLMNSLVNTVAMTTLVVGPFHLARALGLGPAAVGLVMTTGPMVAALVGVPAGRGVDRFGSRCVMRVGLLLMLAGCVGFATLPWTLGVVAYVLPLVVTTAGFAIFLAANSTAVMTSVTPSQRGVVSALLTLSRNLGLITGASTMGAVFVAATGGADIASASGAAIADGTHTAFAVGALLVAAAFAVTLWPARTPSIEGGQA